MHCVLQRVLQCVLRCGVLQCVSQRIVVSDCSEVHSRCDMPLHRPVLRGEGTCHHEGRDLFICVT